MSDLRTFSRENSWEVGGEYIENDVSAHSGEERPEYDRLMADAIEAAREPGVRVIVRDRRAGRSGGRQAVP
ncbi:recombinase family protein [Streptomyces acidicola]|uniref:recombinase family protein n=1 Tax=Streptomyces acidicola TaxID=2596892 RepID=UPI0037983683